MTSDDTRIETVASWSRRTDVKRQMRVAAWRSQFSDLHTWSTKDLDPPLSKHLDSLFSQYTVFRVWLVAEPLASRHGGCVKRQVAFIETIRNGIVTL